MGKVRIKLHETEVGSLLQDALPLISELTEKVLKEAKATAGKFNSETVDEYAAAGFTGKVEPRTKRPRGVVKSNADGETALRAQFASQKLEGVAHLRAALYKHVPKTKKRGRR